MNDNPLVYSTQTGPMCPGCGKPVPSCSCRKRKSVEADKQTTGYPNDGTIRIQGEIKGRKGKIVTAVFGVPLEKDGIWDVHRFITFEVRGSSVLPLTSLLILKCAF